VSILKEPPEVDDPERLKRKLFALRQAEKIGYVRVVGDADVLSVRYMVLDRVTPPATLPFLRLPQGSRMRAFPLNCGP